MQKFIDGKQDSDNTLSVSCKCGNCFNTWMEEVDADKVIIPNRFSAIDQTKIGYIAKCPKCQKKDVLMVDEVSASVIIKYINKEGDSH